MSYGKPIPFWEFGAFGQLPGPAKERDHVEIQAVFAHRCAVLCCAFAAHAQQGRGRILGTVSDTSGAAVAGVKVAIVNIDTTVAVNVESNKDGYYTSPALNVGNYQVVAEHPGFKKAVSSGIVLQVDQQAEINIRLDVGAVSESVEVTGAAPLVNTENGSIGQVIDNRSVEVLPLNGRNAFALALLAPDVHPNAGPIQSGFADRGTSLSDWSINGGPNSVNNMLVDGMVASNSYYPDLNADLAVDAVQEFKVQSGSMSAEFGFTSTSPPRPAPIISTARLTNSCATMFSIRATPSPPLNCLSAITNADSRWADPSSSPKFTTAGTRRSFSVTGNSTTTLITARALRPCPSRPGATAISPTYIRRLKR
jgi:hypothetical protein